MAEDTTQKKSGENVTIRVPFDEFWRWLWKREHLISNWLLPSIVTLLLLLISALSQWDTFIVNWTSNLINILLEFVLLLVAINFPRFLLEKMTNLSGNMVGEVSKVNEKLDTTEKDIKKKLDGFEDVMMKKISDLSHIMVFQTDNHTLEEKLTELKQLNNSPRWIYLKYISKILSNTFKEFKIEFSETSKYSDFSSEIMKECSRSVYLTSSMTPYEWLSSLAKDDIEKKKFFNNVSKSIQLNESNHSKVLRGIPIDQNKKKRIVCLSELDYNHLFLFERGLKAYLEHNNGIETVFCKWATNHKDIKPLRYEYALYDESLLFKFEKETRKLELLSEKNHSDEFTALKKFFLTDNVSTINAKQLLEEIKTKKQDLLKDVKAHEYQIPHKYSYLFHDNWTHFIDESFRFGQNARNAIADLIDKLDDVFFNDVIDIVEIGAGNGDKIDLICDRIGSEKVVSYRLIDISDPLISESYSLLTKRFAGKKNKNSQIITTSKQLLDFCDTSNNNSIDLFRNKTVLIINNSTIFTEYNFPWDVLKWAKKIFITLDLYEKNTAKDLFEEYYKARELFLSPLKIYGIPIVENLVKKGKEDVYKNLFEDNSSSSDYTNDKPYYKVYFKLKEYIQQLKEKESIDFSIDDNDFLGDESYKQEIESFFIQEIFVVLSSLKFIESDDLVSKIESFFHDKLGENWVITVKSNKNSEDTYIGICIEKNETHKEIITKNQATKNGRKTARRRSK